jgi:hypothetical protein
MHLLKSMPPVSALSFNSMLQSWGWVTKNYSEVAINHSEGVKSFGIICGRSTLFPAFFNRWRHFPEGLT